MPKNKRVLMVGEPAPDARVYDCNKCKNPKALLEGELAPKCEICGAAGREQHWIATSKRLIPISRDVDEEFKKRLTWQDKVADAITGFCGSMFFVYIHAFWFGFWLLANTGLIPGVEIFDPFPFGLLTLVVSLEAIILATFILISQNRQAEHSDLRSEYDYQVNLKTEKQITEILELLKEMHPETKKTKK